MSSASPDPREPVQRPGFGPRPAPPKASPWPFVGLALLAAGGFLVLASGPVTPWWGQLLLAAVWVAALVRALTWWTPHPGRVVWVAVAELAAWFAVLVAGAALGGWAS